MSRLIRRTRATDHLSALLDRPAVRCLSTFLRDRAGNTLIFAAFSLPVLLGAAGISVDVGMWYLQRSRVQTAADAGAMAGAREMVSGGTTSTIRQAALRDAGFNSFDAATDVITVNRPPQSGPRTGSSDSVEVIIRRTMPRYFSKPFLSSDILISGRAVARTALNNTCIWALNPTRSGAVSIGGTASAQLGCGIQVNSSDGQALQQGGSSCLTASSVDVVGGASGSCINPSPATGVVPKADPLANLPAPVSTGCANQGTVKINAGQSATLSPGVYCGGVSISSSATVVFSPGTYIFQGDGLSINAQANVTGSGVTFYLTPQAAKIPTITINGGALVRLSAPTSGSYAGILMYGDRTMPEASQKLTGGSAMHLDGAIYMPSQHIDFAGGASLDLSNSMLIADTISLTGNSSLGDLDSSTAKNNANLTTVVLTE